MIVRQFPIEMDRDRVLFLMDCKEDNPVYEQVDEEYQSLRLSLNEYIEPTAGLILGTITQELANDELAEADEAVFVLLSVGKKGSEYVSELFMQGDYLRGMVADAMLDEYLFQMDLAIKPQLIQLARSAGKGIAKRLEAPNGIGMQAQKRIHELLNAEETMHITINQSLMYDPIKSMGLVYLLSENADEFHVEHDCSKCRQKECRFKSGKERYGNQYEFHGTNR